MNENDNTKLDELGIHFLFIPIPSFSYGSIFLKWNISFEQIPMSYPLSIVVIARHKDNSLWIIQ